MSTHLHLKWKHREVRTVAGCDVSANPRERNFYAAVVVMSYPDFDILEQVCANMEVDFPYIPGLLSFREMPVLLEAWKQIKTIPDLTLCDGSGLIHPRRFGLACHLGLWLKIPVVGVAKNLLCGEYDELDSERGSVAQVRQNGEVIGVALRTKTDIKPLFISPGNLIDIERSIEFTLKLCTKYRLPEPIRAAHMIANQFRNK